MRALSRKRLIVGLAAALVLAAGTVVFVRTRPAARPVDPGFSFTQNAAGVHVHFHNPNAHVGLQDQPVEIFLKTADGMPIRRLGPDRQHTIFGKPKEPSFHCCTITLLPPRGDFTITIPPVDVPVGRVDITMRGGPRWVPM